MLDWSDECADAFYNCRRRLHCAPHLSRELALHMRVADYTGDQGLTAHQGAISIISERISWITLTNQSGYYFRKMRSLARLTWPRELSLAFYRCGAHSCQKHNKTLIIPYRDGVLGLGRGLLLKIESWIHINKLLRVESQGVEWEEFSESALSESW